MTQHRNLTGVQVHDSYQYVQASDPGVVGAGKNWLDTTSTPYIPKRRNSANDAWINVGIDEAVDPTAIHIDGAGEFDAVDEKVTPVAGDKVLIEDSEDGGNKKWVDTDNFGGGGGGGASRVLISTLTPTGTTASFTSIPATYSKLIVEYVARGDINAGSVSMDITFNNDTTDANYRRQLITAYSATTVVGGGGDDNVINDAVLALTAPSNEASYGIVEIPSYAVTTFNKSVLSRHSHRRDTNSVQQQIDIRGVDWESIVAINRVDFILASGNFVAGSTFKLYGEVDVTTSVLLGEAWNQVLNETGVSFGNFTAASGTWASNGTVIQQTNAGASPYRARFNTKIDMSHFIFEAEVYSVSGIYIGLLCGFDGTNNAGLLFRIQAGNNICNFEKESVSNLRNFTVTVAVSTWYKLRVIYSGGIAVAYVDGTILGSISLIEQSVTFTPDYIGLYTENTTGNFRNIKAWSLNQPT